MKLGGLLAEQYYVLQGVDDYVLGAIERGKCTLTAIVIDVEDSAPHAMKQASERNGSRLPHSRVVDRSLQRMRKAGLIKYTRIDGWRITKSAA